MNFWMINLINFYKLLWKKFLKNRLLKFRKNAAPELQKKKVEIERMLKNPSKFDQLGKIDSAIIDFL